MMKRFECHCRIQRRIQKEGNHCNRDANLFNKSVNFNYKFAIYFPLVTEKVLK